jgi:hypothetical protein
LVWIDYSDGTEVKRQDLSAWWTGPAPDGNGNAVFGPTALSFQNNRLALASHASSLHMLLDPYYDDDRDFVLSANDYGDGFGDKVSGKRHDPEVPPYPWSIALDNFQFSLFPLGGLDTNSFGLMAPDGVGLGYYAIGNPPIPLRGAGMVDSNSSYDGLYVDCGPGEYSGLRYVAQDVFRGIIWSEYMKKATIHFIPVSDFRNPYHTFLFLDENHPPAFPGKPLGHLDEIGVFSPSGMCVGSAIWIIGAGKWKVYLYGDDPRTASVEGLRDGESFSFRIWDHVSKEEYPADAVLESGKAVYRTGATYTVVSLRAHEILHTTESSPAQFALLQNSPNPFNPSTTISFSLPQAGRISLAIHDITGRLVDEPARGFYPAGTHSVVWDASDRASGVYFCTLNAGQGRETRKMLLVR